MGVVDHTALRDKRYFLLSLLTLCLLYLGIFATVGQEELEVVFFNSDTLYQPSLYRDLFEQSNALNEWRLNPAPNFFPDMLLYSLLMWITDSIQWSSFLFAMIQLVVIDVLILAILRTISSRPYQIMLIANFLLMLFPLCYLVSDDFFFVFFFISNSYHLGCFVMTLLALYLLLRILKQPKPLLWFFMCLSISLGTASDKLFITNFIIPATVYLIYQSFFKADRKRTVWALVAIPLSSFFGWFWVNFLDINGYLEVESPHSFMNFANIGDSFRLFGQFVFDYLTFTNTVSLILILCIISMLLMLIRSTFLLFKRSDDASPIPILITAIVVCTLASPLLVGNFTGIDTIRYNYHGFILLLAFFPYFIAAYRIALPDHRFTRLSALGVCLFLILSISIQSAGFSGIGRYFSFYPEIARKADIFSRETGIKSGTAEYWKAKVITHFSKEGVFVVPTFPKLLPWDHATSKALFYKHPIRQQPNTFGFTLWNEPETFERLEQEFGDSVAFERVTVEDLEFVIHPSYTYERASYLIIKQP